MNIITEFVNACHLFQDSLIANVNKVPWILYFDICAICLNIVLGVVFSSFNNFKTNQCKVYQLMIFSAIGSSLTDLLSAIVSTIWVGKDHIVLNYLIHMAHFFVQITIPALYALFAFLIINDEKISAKQWWVIIIPFSIVVIGILFTPFCGFEFYIDDQGYHRGMGQIVNYLSASFYLLVCLYEIIKNKRLLNKQQLCALVFYTVFTLTLCLIQLFFYRFLLQEIGISFSLFFIFLTLQNPLEFIDANTGSFNRNLFEKIVKINLNRKKNFSVIALKVGGIAYVNEKAGSDGGNAILKSIAVYLKSLDRKNTVYHFFGPQFVILVEGIKDATDYVNTILSKFDLPWFVNQNSYTLSVNMNVVKYPSHVHCLKDVLGIIDYNASSFDPHNTNSATFGNSSYVAQRHRTETIKAAITDAISNKSFEIHYQPIFDVSKQVYSSCEALCRLYTPSMGYIPPDEFIHLAEQSGEIGMLGEIVVEQVCSFIQRFHPEQYGVNKFHINLSPAQCDDISIVSRFLNIIDSFNVPHSMINFEITETVAAKKFTSLNRIMDAFNETNIRFSLDDYGTGYSNIANVMNYPYSVIKLDKSIVWAAEKSHKSAISLKYTMAMIHELKMSILAEGVETEKQATMLAENGCDYFQGFFYSKPIRGELFLDVVKNNRVAALEQKQ